MGKESWNARLVLTEAFIIERPLLHICPEVLLSPDASPSRGMVWNKPRCLHSLSSQEKDFVSLPGPFEAIACFVSHLHEALTEAPVSELHDTNPYLITVSQLHDASLHVI